MSDTTFQKCPRCGNSLTAGFAHKVLGLSFVAPGKLSEFHFWRRGVGEGGVE